MRLRFEESEDPVGFAIVKENGMDTDTIFFETVGILSYEGGEPVLFTDSEFSGVLHLEELKEIVTFMEKKIDNGRI